MTTPTTNYQWSKPDGSDAANTLDETVSDALDGVDDTMATVSARASGAVAKSLYEANSILYSSTQNSPVALVVPTSTVVGRADDEIVALTMDQLATLLALVAADISDFNAAVRLNTVAQLAAPATSFDMNANKITGGATPTNATDFAIKSYVDALAATGQQVKTACATSTTANITLSGEQTIDGVLTSASRVLVKDQSTASQNGIYVSAAGSWTRATDADAGSELVNAYVAVTGGTVGRGQRWQQVTPATITVGSTSIVWNLYADAFAGFTTVTKTANYTAQDRELVLIDATSADITVLAQRTAGVQSIFKRIDSSSHTVTLSTVAGSIDHGASISLTSQDEARWTHGDGTNVWVIGQRTLFGSPVALGGAASDGVSGTVARADHVHSTRVSATAISADYSILSADEGKAIEHNSSSAHTITVTSQATGMTMEVYAQGTGQVTLTADSGVTLRAPNGAKSAHQYATIGLRWRSATEVVLSGDTTT